MARKGGGRSAPGIRTCSCVQGACGRMKACRPRPTGGAHTGSEGHGASLKCPLWGSGLPWPQPGADRGGRVISARLRPLKTGPGALCALRSVPGSTALLVPPLREGPLGAPLLALASDRSLTSLHLCPLWVQAGAGGEEAPSQRLSFPFSWGCDVGPSSRLHELALRIPGLGRLGGSVG